MPAVVPLTRCLPVASIVALTAGTAAAVPPEGIYRLVSACGGKVLEVLGGSSADARQAVELGR